MSKNPTNADEQYELGYSYLNRSDYEKAIFWFSKAAEQDHVEAMSGLARCYMHEGGPCSNEYWHWISEAAQHGESGSQYMLGSAFRGGTVLFSKDREKAKYWLTKAAEQGHKDAQKELKKLENGCYIATCVYGSYDCSEVWTLRRYRDSKLSTSWFGRQFIRIYYRVSPKIVKLFGNKKSFNNFCKPVLNKFVRILQNSGIDNSPYSD